MRAAETISTLIAVIISVVKKIIITIIIFLVLISPLIYKIMSEPGCRISHERGIGSAISATIQAKHSDFLNNAVPYTLDDVLADTSFTGGITYNTTPNNTPARDDVCSNVAGDKICVNLKGGQFDWNWTPQVGNTPALIDENSSSAFP